MGVEVNQTESTRNQSRATYEQKVVFLFDNRYQEEVCWNEEATPNVPVGAIVKRYNEGGNGSCEPIYLSVFVNGSGDENDIHKIIGVLATDFEGQSKPVNVCTKGTVSSNHLMVKKEDNSGFEPANLEAINGATGLRLRDVLERLGLHLQSSVEHTKFDN